MNTDKLLKEIEDALVAASKYTDENLGRILMTKARAKTLIAEIRATRAKSNKVKSLSRIGFAMYGIK